jgi:alkylation response protein AidB-like acyl-CoA dehydrogenase
VIPNDEQRALQETARRFSRERLLPDYIKRERIGTLDRGLVLEMGKLGFLGVDLPERFCGLATTSVTAGLIAEAATSMLAPFRSASRSLARSFSRTQSPRSCNSGCPA